MTKGRNVLCACFLVVCFRAYFCLYNVHLLRRLPIVTSRNKAFIEIFWYFSWPHSSNGVYRQILITYFTVIQTKTYIFHISILSKFIAITKRRKSVSASPKSFSCTSKKLFATHFLLVTRNVCLLKIPEFFAQNTGTDPITGNSFIGK